MSDTTDIVARLEAMAAGWLLAGLPDAALPKEAADEITRLRAAPAQAGAPEGWQLVPVEPTQRMVTAGQHVREQSGWSASKSIYIAMLKAAPATQAGAGREPWGWHAGDGSPAHPADRVAKWPANNRERMRHAVYAHPSPAQRGPLGDARVREMLNEANIELRSKWACYERGLRDGERAHGITTSGTKGAARREPWTALAKGVIAGDGRPCLNDHDPDCRWPQCVCREREAAQGGTKGAA